MNQLLRGGFAGKVVPINPSYGEVAGIGSIPSLAELDRAPDLVVLAVGDKRLEEQLELAVSVGAGSVVIFSPALGEAADGTPLRRRLATIARAAGIPLCGANGMGFVNVEKNLRVCGFHQPFGIEPGSVTFLSHSGSLFSAMLHNNRQMRFNLVVSTGLELVTTMDEYLGYALGLPTTRVVCLFLETIRRPQAMAAALARASARDIPVVALKVGRSARGKKAAATHSGALAGEDSVYQAFFAAHGVHVVESMDELMDTAEIFTVPRRPRPGGLGSVHDSGGERTLLLDVAESEGVPLAQISPTTRERLARALDPGLEPDNPVDAWGTGHDAEEVFAESLRALADDPAVGLVAFAVDMTAEEKPDGGYTKLLIGAERDLAVPLVVLANLASGIDPVQSTELRGAGIPVLQGTTTGMRAIGHALAHARRARRSEKSGSPPRPEVTKKWRDRLASNRSLLEAEGLDLLADYGIPTIPTWTAASPAEVTRAWERSGGPVALKTAAGHLHKTEVDGVRLGLDSHQAVMDAYEEIASRLGRQVVIQPMAEPGVELALGVINDLDFGPLVVVAAGGRLVELLDDRALVHPPVDHVAAEEALDRLKVARLLAGVRGGGPLDRRSVIETIVKVGVLAADLGDMWKGLDINPLLVSANGVVAVDALVVV